ncbi:MAG: efflux RND transporter periplasmic adaptor subunit [Eubacteriales bacterium]|nr:efflux RND transporter periplasmic adaptor subunit [Eubacteriales bacterium]
MKKKKTTKRMVITSAIIITVLIAIFVYIRFNEIRNLRAVTDTTQQEYIVDYGSIRKTITGSGSIQPSDTRLVSADQTGVIDQLFADIGQLISKDDVLAMYEIEKDENAERINTENARFNLQKAIKTLNDLNEIQRSLRIVAENSGIVRLNVNEGDLLPNNAVIGEISEVGIIKLQSYFTKDQMEKISLGDEAEVFLQDYLLTLTGTVTGVDRAPVAMGSGSLGYMIRVEISYDGALQAGTSAKLTVINQYGRFASPFVGESIKNQTKTLNAPYASTVKQLMAENGSHVNAGDLIAVMESEELTYNIRQQEIIVEQRRLDVNELGEQDTIITSPIDGTILDIMVNEKSYVDRGTQLLKIADLEKMEVRINIDELDILSIEKNQKVTITSDVFEGDFFEGFVKNISLSGASQGGVTTFEVVIGMTDRKNLMSGMNVDVEILVAEKNNALIIPISAVSKIAGKYVVMMNNADGPYPVTIEAGIITDSFVEVLAGLKQGDTIINVVASDVLTDGGNFFPGGQRPGGGGNNQ